jgi:hypothetical protein
MITELVLQARRSAAFYAVIVVLVAGLGLWQEFAGSEVSTIVGQLGLFGVWVVMMVAAGVDLFGYYWSSKDMLLLLAPWPRGRLLAGKAAIHGLWFLIVFIVSCAGLIIPTDGKAVGLATIMALIGGRALGIVAFFCLLALLLRLAKLISQQFVAIGLVVAAYLAITAAGLWWTVVATTANGPERFWMIGFTNDAAAPTAQYVNLLPLMIGANQTGHEVAVVEPVALLINGGTIVGCVLIWQLLRRLPVNFVRAT